MHMEEGKSIRNSITASARLRSRTCWLESLILQLGLWQDNVDRRVWPPSPSSKFGLMRPKCESTEPNVLRPTCSGWWRSYL